MAESYKIIYALIVALLYVPLVFLGTHTFFPEAERPDFECFSEPCKMDDCSDQIVNRQVCQEEYNSLNKLYEEENRMYGAYKYIFILLFNIIILAILLRVRFEESIIVGLFFGAVLSAFIATMEFFDTKSKIGFFLLLLLFILTVFFINKRKRIFSKN